MPKLLVMGLTMGAVVVAAGARVNQEPTAETVIVSALRTIAGAQRGYASQHGGYARSLQALATPCAAGEPPFISPSFSSDPTRLRGYEIRIEPDPGMPTPGFDCRGNTTVRAYYATAVPLARSGTTPRAFAIDRNGVIWYDVTGRVPKPPFAETGAMKPLR